MSAFTLASYNVHRCIGLDRRRRPQRIAAALQQLGADVIGLQEVDTRDHAPGHGGLVSYLARETGLAAVSGPSLFHDDGGFYGNVILTRFPVEDVRMIDLSVRGREPRSALDVDLRIGAALLRLVVTHLGLTGRERREQVARLLAALERPARPLLAVTGDFNEWLPRSPAVAALDRALGTCGSPRTFPAWRPLLALDRLWVRPAAALEELHAVLTRLSLRASDHLPLRARVTVPER